MFKENCWKICDGILIQPEMIESQGDAGALFMPDHSFWAMDYCWLSYCETGGYNANPAVQYNPEKSIWNQSLIEKNQKINKEQNQSSTQRERSMESQKSLAEIN